MDPKNTVKLVLVNICFILSPIEDGPLIELRKSSSVGQQVDSMTILKVIVSKKRLSK